MEGIRKAREAAGLTQTDLAKRLGVTPGAISQMESRGRYADASRLPEIADALGCRIDTLFGRADPIVDREGG